MAHPRWVRRFLTAADLDDVTRAVTEAEAGTSGEIRVHLDAVCPGDPMARAVSVFERLGMHRTARRNGVLIYVAIEDRKLAVIGDVAVHARAGPEYWEGLSKALSRHFRAGRPAEGLQAVLRDVGAILRHHFPAGPEDRNELSDQLSLE